MKRVVTPLIACLIAGGLAIVGGMAPASAESSTNGFYKSLDVPTRVLDTRSGLGQGGSTQPLGAKQSLDVAVSDLGPDFPFGFAAVVVMNVTVTEPTASSFLALWPAGETQPIVSNLNFVADQTVPNLVTVPLGADEKVSVYNNAGSVHVVIDVVGWYTSGAGSVVGSVFNPRVPLRLFDTRNGQNQLTVGKLGEGQTAAFDIHNTAGAYPGGSSLISVVLNVTATNATAPSYLTVWANGEARPTASNLNFVPGQTVANLVIARVSPAGVINFYNHLGSTDVVVDLVGYMQSAVQSDVQGRVVPVPPLRVYDSRDPGSLGALPPEAVLDLQIGTGIPISGLVLNITVTVPTAAGFLTAYTVGFTRPFTSNVNFVPGLTVPNHVMIAINGNHLLIYNSAGSTHVVVDVFGLVTGAGYVPPTATLSLEPVVASVTHA